MMDDVPDRFWHMQEDEVRQILDEQIRNAPYCRDPKFTWSMVMKMRLVFWDEFHMPETPRSLVAIPKCAERMQWNRLQYQQMMKNYPALLPWIFHPPAQQELKRRYLLEMAENRMEDILSICPVRDGKVDSRLARVQVDIYEILQNRLYGAVPQIQKNLNLNAEVSKDTAAKINESFANLTDLEEIDRRLTKIQEETKRLKEVAPIQVNQDRLVRPDKIAK